LAILNNNLFSVLFFTISAKRAFKREGFNYLLRSGLNLSFSLLKSQFQLWYYKVFKSSETFEFQGISYPYHYHLHSTTWKNERSVEIPIIWNILKKNEGKRVLEVGNVLSHIFTIQHDVVDKYEIGEHIINEDIVSFNPPNKYDLIVSISTLEHVGWDETPKDPYKIVRAIDNLKRLLSPSGQMFATMPLGYNPELDRLLRNNELGISQQHFLKRMSKNKWQVVGWEDVMDVKYDTSIPTANGIIVAAIVNEE
jgi:hypothetical protein